MRRCHSPRRRHRYLQGAGAAHRLLRRAALFPAANYVDVLFNPAPTTRPYSVRSYYEQLSNGLVTIDGVVRPFTRADSSSAYYEDGCNGIGIGTCGHVDRFTELLIGTLQHNDDGTFNWAQFDTDGDGYVDFVTFLQSERTGPAAPSTSGPTASYISGWTGGSPYVTKTPWPGHPGQFIKVEDYTIQSAVGGTTACTAGQIMPIGTLAHETGHAFGLPDLYDTDGTSEGIGEWGLMSSGNYAIPFSPARYEAWSLVQMGWVKVDTLSSSRTVITAPVTASDTVFYITVPGTNEYFLVENRQALESDSAQMNPAYNVIAKMPGLLIWHVDQDKIDAHGMTIDNRVNTGLVHGLALMEADGKRNLWANPGTASSNRGDLGDSYPGSTGNTRFSYRTFPSGTRQHRGHHGLEDRLNHAGGPQRRDELPLHPPGLDGHRGGHPQRPDQGQRDDERAVRGDLRPRGHRGAQRHLAPGAGRRAEPVHLCQLERRPAAGPHHSWTRRPRHDHREFFS